MISGRVEWIGFWRRWNGRDPWPNVEQLKKKKERKKEKKTSPNWKAKTRFDSALSRFARNYERVTIARWNDVFFLYSPLYPLSSSFTLFLSLPLFSLFILYFTVEGGRDARSPLDERRAPLRVSIERRRPGRLTFANRDPNLSPCFAINTGSDRGNL